MQAKAPKTQAFGKEAFVPEEKPSFAGLEMREQ